MSLSWHVFLQSFLDLKKKISSLQEEEATYPLIIFPDSFAAIFDSSVSFESVLDFCRRTKGDQPCLWPLKEPERPSEPRICEVPTTHWEKRKESFWKSTNGSIFKMWLVVAILFGGLPGFSMFTSSILDRFGGALLFLALWLPLLAILLIRNGEKRRTVSIEIPYSEEELVAMREEEKLRYEKAVEEYPGIIELYETHLAQYKEAKRKQDALILSCKSAFLSNHLKSAFSQSDNYSIVNDPPQKGRCEDLLFASLMHTLPDLVHIDTTISGYYPDIMVSTQNGVFIDIEIDEPYEMTSRKEIHYIGCDDEERNARIAKKGWMIIRFSEKQVMTNCFSCTKMVRNLVNIIDEGDLQAVDDLITITETIKDKRWRKEDARMMSINNYRRTY